MRIDARAPQVQQQLEQATLETTELERSVEEAMLEAALQEVARTERGGRRRSACRKALLGQGLWNPDCIAPGSFSAPLCSCVDPHLRHVSRFALPPSITLVSGAR